MAPVGEVWITILVERNASRRMNAARELSVANACERFACVFCGNEIATGADLFDALMSPDQ
jgi:hypothetical protein